MSDARTWRDAKLPQWAKDSIAAETAQWKLTAALSWPTEAKPQPLPFLWAGYDKLFGTPAPGRYWQPSAHRIEAFDLARIDDLDARERKGLRSYFGWAFRTQNGGEWHTSVVRGPLFASEQDAKLYRVWLLCEDFALQLMKAKGGDA